MGDRFRRVFHSYRMKQNYNLLPGNDEGVGSIGSYITFDENGKKSRSERLLTLLKKIEMSYFFGV